MTDARIVAAFARNPFRCVCDGGEAGPSTHRAPAHLTTCRHSTLRDTTRGYRPLARLRPIRGRRGWVTSWEG